MSDETPAADVPRCKHLCCKSMLVYGEAFESDPDYQAGMVDWTCVRTGQRLGPDNDDVDMPSCSNPERTCYRAF